jgi:hypothetical protein
MQTELNRMNLVRYGRTLKYLGTSLCQKYSIGIAVENKTALLDIQEDFREKISISLGPGILLDY